MVVSVLSSLGVALGFVLLIVPGIVWMTRWAVAVPVVMYERASPREALRRSSQLVRGHGRDVWVVIVNAAVRAVVVGLVIGTAASWQGSLLAAWIGTTVAAAVTTPYVAHTLSVLYYRLTEPDRPLIPEPGRCWDSVWREDEARQSH